MGGHQESNAPSVKQQNTEVVVVTNSISAALDKPEMDGKGVVRVPRETWGRKAQFVLSCVGYAVGLGNVWRFPYLCYKSGGGAFLIPYFLMLFFTGVPLLLLELAVGQYTRNGPVKAIKMLAPILQGTGFATVAITFLLTTYYNVIMAWALFYLVASFSSELPWDSCENEWNTEKCFSLSDYKMLNDTTEKPSDTVSSTEEYFNHRVLKLTGGIEDFGEVQWEVFGFLVLAWIMVYFCLCKGLKTSGKVVYLTVTFPYLVLAILVGVGASLEGASEGLYFFIKPKWELLKNADVWVAAAAQNFNSIGIAFGSMIAFSSYNEFHSRTLVRDTLVISGVNAFTSLFASCAIFSVIGHIAFIQGEDVDNVVTQGPGLVFAVYPAAFSAMPVPQLWSVLFFIMLICLGLDSQFAMVEVVITTLMDGFPRLKPFYFNRKEVLVLYVCLFTFACGIPCTFEGGMYYFQIIDWYVSVVSIFFIAIGEVVAVSWLYGAGRLRRNVEEMTSSAPNLYFVSCWFIISPLLIFAIFVFSFIQYEVVTYGDYNYPGWAEFLGWFIAMLSMIWIPVGIVYAFASAEGSFTERLVLICKSPISEATYGYRFQDDSTTYRRAYFDRGSREDIFMSHYKKHNI
ncbi:sodium- and chloride-dependent GABA transporter ine-like [Anneissia japonica]|uniref:sodium- and chloride-dependent GABA transporter ine-like n=1 Tax=Anneissia japonica TaxID=1529436 RepID=UPI001425B56D|nr:sodium- and chloride-dependent GABA transporter ine-like [Anneissia japonica]